MIPCIFCGNKGTVLPFSYWICCFCRFQSTPDFLRSWAFTVMKCDYAKIITWYYAIETCSFVIAFRHLGFGTYSFVIEFWYLAIGTCSFLMCFGFLLLNPAVLLLCYCILLFCSCILAFCYWNITNCTSVISFWDLAIENCCFVIALWHFAIGTLRPTLLLLYSSTLMVFWQGNMQFGMALSDAFLDTIIYFLPKCKYSNLCRNLAIWLVVK